MHPSSRILVSHCSVGMSEFSLHSGCQSPPNASVECLRLNRIILLRAFSWACVHGECRRRSCDGPMVIAVIRMVSFRAQTSPNVRHPQTSCILRSSDHLSSSTIRLRYPSPASYRALCHVIPLGVTTVLIGFHGSGQRCLAAAASIPASLAKCTATA